MPACSFFVHGVFLSLGNPCWWDYLVSQKIFGPCYSIFNFPSYLLIAKPSLQKFLLPLTGLSPDQEKVPLSYYRSIPEWVLTHVKSPVTYYRCTSEGLFLHGLRGMTDFWSNTVIKTLSTLPLKEHNGHRHARDDIFQMTQRTPIKCGYDGAEKAN